MRDQGHMYLDLMLIQLYCLMCYLILCIKLHYLIFYTIVYKMYHLSFKELKNLY